MVTPSNLTWSCKVMDVVDMLTVDMLAMEAQRCLVPNRIASDLSGLSARPLWVNQEHRSERHDSRSLMRTFWFGLEIEIYSWVSSAYCCCDKPWRDAILAIGEV